MGMTRSRQHVPLRIPSGWSGESRALVIQLERTLDEIYALLSKAGKEYKNLPAASGGTDLSLVTTGDKYTWDSAAPHTGAYTWGELKGL